MIYSLNIPVTATKIRRPNNLELPVWWASFYYISILIQEAIKNIFIPSWPKLHQDRKSPAPLNSCSDVRDSVTESWY